MNYIFFKGKYINNIETNIFISYDSSECEVTYIDDNGGVTRYTLDALINYCKEDGIDTSQEFIIPINNFSNKQIFNPKNIYYLSKIDQDIYTIAYIENLLVIRKFVLNGETYIFDSEINRMYENLTNILPTAFPNKIIIVHTIENENKVCIFDYRNDILRILDGVIVDYTPTDIIKIISTNIVIFDIETMTIVVSEKNEGEIIHNYEYQYAPSQKSSKLFHIGTGYILPLKNLK